MGTSLQREKIAILTLHPANGGGVLSSLRVVYNILAEFFDPTVFYIDFDPRISASLRHGKVRSSVRYTRYDGMPCVGVGARWAFWEPGHYRYTLAQWRDVLRDYRYFFVTSGTVIPAHPLVELGKRFVVWAATSYDEDRATRTQQMRGIRKIIDRRAMPHMHRIERDILEAADVVLAMSNYARRSFESIVRTPCSYMGVVGYPIMPLERTVNFNNLRSPTIIAVGRFSDPRKNAAMLFRAFDRIVEKRPTAQLYVVGAPPSPEVCAPFQHLSSFKRITFYGMCDDEARDALYKKAHIMLITSYQEGLGIVGLEALARGIPVVATDCGGTADYVINNTTGFLVPIDDDVAMAERALTILGDASYAKRLSEQGHAFIDWHYAPSVIRTAFIQALVYVYPELDYYCAHYYHDAVERIRGETSGHRSHIHSVHQS